MAKIGLQYPVFAPIASESGSTITYGNGVVLGRAVSANLSWESQDNKLYGDDAVAETDNSVTGYTLDIETTEMTEAVEAAVLGYAKVGSTDEYEVTADAGPEGGVGYIQVLKRNGVLAYKAFWYPKIQFGVQNDNGSTKADSISWGTPTIHGVGSAVDAAAEGKKKFRNHQLFTTLAAAKSYLNSKAGIT